jgi:hypothetical protein
MRHVSSEPMVMTTPARIKHDAHDPAGSGCVYNPPIRLFDGSRSGVCVVGMQTRGAKRCFVLPVPA